MPRYLALKKSTDKKTPEKLLKMKGLFGGLLDISEAKIKIKRPSQKEGGEKGIV
jgi:hypothetical protein